MKCQLCGTTAEFLYAIDKVREQACLLCWHEQRNWDAYTALNVKIPKRKKAKT